jgi:parvulin-like peptidyl-prolyl isomerase
MFRHKNDGARIMHFFTSTDTIASFIFDTLNITDESIDRKELLANYQVDVSTVEKGSLVDELDNALFSSTRSRNVIGPIQTEYGFHVIEILGRYSAGSQIDIDEGFDEIYQILYNQKKELRTVAFMDSLRNHYNVKINLEIN